MRSVDSRRARSILTLIVVLWFLARPRQGGGHWGFIVKGLPYGAFCALVAFFENYGDSERTEPHVNTVWGTHRAGGRFDRGQLGYMASLRQAGLIDTDQPAWWTVGASYRGKMRTMPDGKTQCWAFAEIYLRIPEPGATLGPGTLMRTPLPPPAEPREPKPSPQRAPLPIDVTDAVPAPESFTQMIEEARGRAAKPLEQPRPKSAGIARPLAEGAPHGPLAVEWMKSHPMWSAVLDELKRGPPSTS